MAGMRGRGGAGLEALPDRAGEIEAALQRAGAEMAGGVTAGQERGDGLVLARLDAGMGGEMQHRRPAA
jgi:hypothetical protein